MKFRIAYLPHVVEEDIPALPNTMKARVKRAIEERLMTDPIAYGKPLRFALKGYRRLRVGDWRVVYSVDSNHSVVTITAIQNRKDVYED